MVPPNKRTLFITGASRGIGKAIAIAAARNGANVAIGAKTVDPDPKLPGTIFTAAEEVEAAGGRALPIKLDVRDEAQVRAAVEETAAHFGGIDILINNASAIHPRGVVETPVRRYDLMMDINVRGTFLCAQSCLIYLLKSENPHILTLAPPIDLNPKWFKPHSAYTTSKYAMSMIALGLAEELREQGVASNTLWPRTLIHTAALSVAAPEAAGRARTPEIMAHAALWIVSQPSRAVSGRNFVDEEVLRSTGQTDFDQYLVDPTQTPEIDLFMES
jgi:citronellol/citronellal dehydrogenase